jgi:serine/threonine protein kinase
MTKPDDIRRILDLAISADPERQQEILDRECGGDADLRAEIEELLLTADLAPGGHTGAPTLGPPEAIPGTSELGAGSTIGPYTLLELLGQGGFGSVYLADQAEPVKRRVALKIIKRGMDTQAVIGRFEQERQALAMMDHPNIAKVLDAGTTEQGRPFFVMEYVEGQTITQYADEHRLTVRQRLELFGQVCNGIQHAHSKGIIHRDIKPSNVIVSTHDGRPFARVIDFGIAKAVDQRYTEETMFTEHGQLIGTPLYMSPEQAEGSLDIDTRSDVYALGVLLYELLTGTTPLDPKQVRAAAFGEIYRMVREIDPPRPSTRLDSVTATLPEVAERRGAAPDRLRSVLRGELDWIAMRALEKERSRRYETANGLAMDIQRYLAGEAVVAAPPSQAYRLKKFVLRNRGIVSAIGAVAAAMLIGVVAFAWQASVARDQRDRAVRAEAETQTKADQLAVVSQFQADMLAQIDPNKAGQELSEDVIARYGAALEASSPQIPEARRERMIADFKREWNRVNATDATLELIDKTILKPAIEAIDTQFVDQPAVDAGLRLVLANQYRELGLYDSAMPLMEAALETNRRELGEEHSETLISLNDMGYLLLLMGRSADAEPYLRDALEKMGEILGEDHRNTLTAMSNLALSLHYQGQLDDAEPVYREALDKRRQALGDDDPDTLVAVSNLGFVLLAQGRLADAEPLLREAMEKQKELLGDDHLDTITAVNNLGYSIQYQGRLDEAEPYVREAYERWRKTLGEDHPWTLVGMNNLALLVQDLGQFDEAERLLRGAVEGRTRALGEEHPDTISSVGNLGRLLQNAGRLDEAETYLRSALEMGKKVHGEDHPAVFITLNNYGVLLETKKDLAGAERYYREAMEKCQRVLGEAHPNTLIATINTSTAVQRQGRNAEARDMLGEIEDRARETFKGSQASWLAKLLTTRGMARTSLGELGDAETDLLEAHELYLASRGEKHRDTEGCVRAIVDLYDALAEAAPGEGHEETADTWRATAVYQ